MQVLFALWLLVVGMKDVLWEGGLETDAVAAPAGAGEVVASEGPVGPPPPNP